MSAKDLDVTAIGNAIVDVISQSTDEFLESVGSPKGSMQLVDADRARELYEQVGPSIEVSGGSAANTMVGVAGFGGHVAFVGRVANDQLGEVFAHDIRAAGVEYNVSARDGGAPTARCIILVTPDAQRTMHTFLGACAELTPEDVSERQIARAHYLYLEGYLWDPADAKEAFRQAMMLAAENDTKVALTLSDSFCVERFREEFVGLAADNVDLLFANEAEICSLFETEDFEQAADQAAKLVETVAITRSEKGSVILQGGNRVDVAAHPVERIVDTTGAGDLYAAGVLRGLSIGASLERCGQLGSIAAAEIISHVGARPLANLADLAR